MRSLVFTFLLVFLAITALGISAWKWTHGSFDSVLGAPPISVGGRVYSEFKTEQVKHIHISQNGFTVSGELTPDGWKVTSPWQDRMDPRAAVGIIDFSLGLRVEDFAEADETDPRKTGLKENNVSIRLEDATHRSLAKYRIGRQTPWLASVKDIKEPVPTVFIQPRDSDRKNYIYACTGDISALFKDNFKFIRDHRPFYFNPTALKQIRIRTAQGELTLGRTTPKSPWRVVKPLDLTTNADAIKSLLEGLYELQAARVSDRSTVTLPTNNAPEQSQQIAITSFDSDQETTLEIFPPETPDSRDVKATVSDRPNTIFEIPYKPEPNLISIASLPLAINDLRDPKITNLKVSSLRGALIQSSTNAEILISRTPPQPWMVTIRGKTQQANEERLFAFLKAVTEERVTGFETDAATDFTPWGLDRPFLKLAFLGENDQKLELAFGNDRKGDFYVNRPGTPTVMKVDPSFISLIPVQAYEWRHDRLWSIDRFELTSIERQVNDEMPIALRYESRAEVWTATQGGKDQSDRINPNRINYMLGHLEGLKVHRWLAPGDEAALKALMAPSLRFKVVEKETDEEGDFKSLLTRELILAPASGEHTGYYYGLRIPENQPFLLDKDTYTKLAVEIYE